MKQTVERHSNITWEIYENPQEFIVNCPIGTRVMDVNGVVGITMIGHVYLNTSDPLVKVDVIERRKKPEESHVETWHWKHLSKAP